MIPGGLLCHRHSVRRCRLPTVRSRLSIGAGSLPWCWRLPMKLPCGRRWPARSAEDRIRSCSPASVEVPSATTKSGLRAPWAGRFEWWRTLISTSDWSATGRRLVRSLNWPRNLPKNRVGGMDCRRPLEKTTVLSETRRAFRTTVEVHNARRLWCTARRNSNFGADCCCRPSTNAGSGRYDLRSAEITAAIRA